MRIAPEGSARPPDLARLLGRLDRLPLRPATARLMLESAAPEPTCSDPGLALEASRPGGLSGLELAAEAAWWPAPAGGAESEALDRLWRHAAAVALAARRLARQAGDPEADRVGLAGLLHGLGLWALAAVAPEALPGLLAIADPARRRAAGRALAGSDLAAVGREMAERLGCDPLVVDAAWLHADRSGRLDSSASDPARLAFVREGFALAERTPWALFPPEGPGGPSGDPAVRLLKAEVQLACPGPFVAADATAREADLARRHASVLLESARLRDRLAEAEAGRSRQARRLDAAVEALRLGEEDEEPTRRAALLEALGEFAAGAGHELNNPLAVILGRAQLLLAATRDPDAARSLRAIVGQAQRAHRILRDLMYVARPPAPRPRPCQPDEILRACLRDAKDEAEARGVRLLADARDPAPRARVDPDPLRHLAEVFVRNALEATPRGGTVRVVGSGDERTLRWSFHDEGRGLSAREQAHLFDPFFCGRQAGRGLGLGLPRAARFVAVAGGELRWSTAPGRGSSFHVTLPLEPPEPGGLPGD